MGIKVIKEHASSEINGNRIKKTKEVLKEL
jgi:hypothetical protein